MPTAATPEETLRGWGGFRGLAAAAVLILVAVAFIAVFSRQGLWEIYRLRQERQRLEWENAQLAQENRRLALTIERLQHDPQMIQDLIRKELNFVRKNEIIIQLPEDRVPLTLPPDRKKPPPVPDPEARQPSLPGRASVSSPP